MVLYSVHSSLKHHDFDNNINLKGESDMANRRKPAETNREWWALLKSADKTVIRSMKDWKAALADPRRNPLKGCSPKAVQHFTKSLKFTNGGLGHADYSKVVDELTYLQFQELWAAFGMGMRIFEDYKDMWCESRATCDNWERHICTSNC